MNQRQIKSELQKLEKSEQKFISRNLSAKEFKWQEKIDKYVPESLSKTLNSAFGKAFELIFEKGTDIIEKTYDREKKEQDFKVNEYSADLRNSKKSVKKFGLAAMGSRTINMAISAVEGVGMGAIGMGIPDIPVFIAVILKSIYEISLHYGFQYDTVEEQVFILKIMETAFLYGDELIHSDMEINEWITSEGKIQFKHDKQEQIKKTSFVMSEELLYLKFIQGMPVVGIIGGVSDVIYQKKITDYAMMKYNRRFLLKHLDEDVVM